MLTAPAAAADAAPTTIGPDFGIVDQAGWRGLNRTSAYNAVCWAAGKTDEAVRAEIARASDLRHTYAWNEVGSRHNDYTRAETLKLVLVARTA